MPRSLLLLVACLGCRGAAPAGDGPADTDLEPIDTGEPVAREDALVLLDELRPETGNRYVHIMDLVRDDAGTVWLATANGAYAIDGADPAALSVRGGPSGAWFYWAALDGDTLALSGRDAGLHLVGVGDGVPEVLASLPIDETDPEGVALHSDVVFVAAGTGGVEVRARGDLSLLATLPADNALDVALAGDTLWVLDREAGLVGWDVTTPTAATARSALALDGAVQALEIDGDVAFIAASDAFAAVDIGDPDAPALRSRTDVDGTCTRVSAADGLLAAASWVDVRLFDVADPAAPRLIAVQDAGEIATSALIDDGVLWLGDWDTLRSFAIDRDARSPEIAADAEVDVVGAAGERVVERLTIENLGDLPLNVASITCDVGVTPSVGALQVAPGDSEGVDLTVDVLDENEARAICTVTSDDADEPAANVVVVINRAGLSVGDLAPDFSLPDLDGDYHTLSDYRGDVVFITLFSTW